MMRAAMRSRPSTSKVLLWTAAAIAASLAAGFVLFAGKALQDATSVTPRADGIVVFTGGEERLSHAARLLREGRARRLLISGVNPRTTVEDLRRLTGLDNGKFDCCVDVGYMAKDTVGNADETRDWAEARGYSSLIIVTASYHMPRSLAEIELEMPHARLIAHPVVPRGLREHPWWRSLSSARVLFAEYVKFLPAALRFTTARFARFLERSATAEARTSRQANL